MADLFFVATWITLVVLPAIATIRRFVQVSVRVLLFGTAGFVGWIIVVGLLLNWFLDHLNVYRWGIEIER